MPPSRSSGASQGTPAPWRVRAWHLKQWYTWHGLVRRATWIPRFLFRDREVTNFTYDIANERELGPFLAKALGRTATEIEGYIEELRSDQSFRDDLIERLGTRKDRNPRPAFGRRLGWYAIVRAEKPRVLVETGTHDGLGAAVLALALRRNDAEGRPGHLTSLDIDPGSGWLVPDGLRRHVTFLSGDIRATLPTLVRSARFDWFMHDSDHSVEHETFELDTALSAMAPGGLVLSDNGHATSAFSDFCRRAALEKHFWRERPRRHPYPGGSISLARVPVTS